MNSDREFYSTGVLAIKDWPGNVLGDTGLSEAGPWPD
jgi:hypothetical protein